MDAVPCSWNAAQAQESFTRGKHAADTLTKLAKLMARADHKPDARGPRLTPLLAAASLPYACAECGRGFADMAELRHHRRGEHPLPKPHQCAACGKAFSLLSSLQLHRRLHDDLRHDDDEDGPPCELCSGGKAPPPPGAPPCPGCAAAATAAVTSDPESPRDKSPPPAHHPGLRHDGGAYACAPCGRAFSQKQALLHHQQSGCSHPEEPDDNADSPPALDSPSPGSEAAHSPASDASNSPDAATDAAAPCPCSYCGRNFRSPAGLNSHQRNYHVKEWLLEKRTRPAKVGRGGGRGGGVGRSPLATNGDSKQKLLACRSCDMEFLSTAKLYLHRKEKHSREKDIRRGDGARPLSNKRRKGETYPCQVCGKVFLHHLSLRAHTKLHNAQSQCQAVASGPGKAPRGPAKLAEKKPKKPKANRLSGGDAAPRPGPGRPRKEARPPQERPEEEGEFPCPSCAEVFPLQSALREHAELHQPSTRRRQCSVCSQDMDVVSKEPGAKRQRLYHCGPCQQAFTCLDAFLQHCQVHLLAQVEEEEGEEGQV